MYALGSRSTRSMLQVPIKIKYYSSFVNLGQNRLIETVPGAAESGEKKSSILFIYITVSAVYA